MRPLLEDKMLEFFQQHNSEVFTVTNIMEKFPDFVYETIRTRLLWLWRKDKIGRRKVGGHFVYGLPTAIEDFNRKHFKNGKLRAKKDDKNVG